MAIELKIESTVYEVNVDSQENINVAVSTQELIKLELSNVVAVGGESGALTKADVGLDQVDNTSDLNKPISLATQAALDLKVDKVAGKGLSTNDFTTLEKQKLMDLDVDAQVPVGGTTGQVLAKASNADYDTVWVNQTGGGGGGTSALVYINYTLI